MEISLGNNLCGYWDLKGEKSLLTLISALQSNILQFLVCQVSLSYATSPILEINVRQK